MSGNKFNNKFTKTQVADKQSVPFSVNMEKMNQVFGTSKPQQRNMQQQNNPVGMFQVAPQFQQYQPSAQFQSHQLQTSQQYPRQFQAPQQQYAQQFQAQQQYPSKELLELAQQLQQLQQFQNSGSMGSAMPSMPVTGLMKPSVAGRTPFVAAQAPQQPTENQNLCTYGGHCKNCTMHKIAQMITNDEEFAEVYGNVTISGVEHNLVRSTEKGKKFVNDNGMMLSKALRDCRLEQKTSGGKQSLLEILSTNSKYEIVCSLLGTMFEILQVAAENQTAFVDKLCVRKHPRSDGFKTCDRCGHLSQDINAKGFYSSCPTTRAEEKNAPSFGSAAKTAPPTHIQQKFNARPIVQKHRKQQADTSSQDGEHTDASGLGSHSGEEGDDVTFHVPEQENFKNEKIFSLHTVFNMCFNNSQESFQILFDKCVKQIRSEILLFLCIEHKNDELEFVKQCRNLYLEGKELSADSDFDSALSSYLDEFDADVSGDEDHTVSAASAGPGDEESNSENAELAALEDDESEE